MFADLFFPYLQFFLLAEISDSQQQIQGVNRQYDQLGELLSDHQRELQFTMLGITSFSEDFEQILLWLHCTEEKLNERGQDDDETQRVWTLFCCSYYPSESIQHNIMLR